MEKLKIHFNLFVCLIMYSFPRFLRIYFHPRLAQSSKFTYGAKAQSNTQEYFRNIFFFLNTVANKYILMLFSHQIYPMPLAGLLYIWHGSNFGEFSGVKTDFHELCSGLVSLTSVLISTWMQIFNIPVLQGGWNVTRIAQLCQTGTKWAQFQHKASAVFLEMKRRGLKDEGIYGVRRRKATTSINSSDRAS